MIRIDPDDPKWTAYVLGELDEAERAAVEAELESCEEARMLVEELRFTADLTIAELRAHAVLLPLTDPQKNAIHTAADASIPARPWFRTRPAIWAGLAAASIALVFLSMTRLPFGPHMPDSRPRPAPAAQVESQDTKDETAAKEADETKPKGEFALRYAHSPQLESTRPQEKAVPTASSAPGRSEDEPAPGTRERGTGGLFGTVQDASATRVPGVAVVATNIGNGSAVATVTNELGTYSLDGLQPGDYRLSGSLAGFQTNNSNIQVDANRQAKQDITLRPAQVSLNVDVNPPASLDRSQRTSRLKLLPGPRLLSSPETYRS